MATQRVLRLTDRTSWHSLTEFREPCPSAGKHEVLIKIRSVALNLRDIVIATGKYPFQVKAQVIPGSDAAGDIIKVGEGVYGFAEGDRVVICYDQATQYGPLKSWGQGLGGPVDGVMREYICVPAHTVVKIPEYSTLTYARWASVACVGVIAWNALHGAVPIKPGQTILFLGTGCMSITGLIIAKAAGATTIITSFSEENLQYVEMTYAPDHTINCTETPDWAAEVLKLTAGQGVDHIFEIGGSATIQHSFRALAYGGVISIMDCLSPGVHNTMPDVVTLALWKGATVRGILNGSKQQLEEVVRFIGSKNLKLPVEKTFEFGCEQVIEAYSYLASGQHIGKVCIDF
ncbi:zinc-containing alcohol dehydrogenase [Penicillium paradoxum]|uniref:zinc-containing alcohol dehydrogenase n=1 Tax=Penicillium paradoxum TaxID=176176 RepID=UPI0025465CF4|nr:zinc-containing alcohol dehydrogenase [Penicillium paradoxum]KAJ5779563.1 zinc-containing alcohol dehydrogenase [Penicillium paradoxum]